MQVIRNNNHWLKQQADLIPNKILVNSGSKKFSYLKLFKLANDYAFYFSERGIKKNTHVAIDTKNALEFLITINALWLIGAIPVPINNRLSKNEKLQLVKFADCEAIVVTENLFYKAKIKILNLSNNQIPEKNEKYIYCKFVPKNIALMMYSSGSTGNPKCVQITFENLYESFIASNKIINHSHGDIWLASLPFYHIGGFSIITRTIIAGCTLTLKSSFHTKALINNMINEKPTYISLVPSILVAIVEQKVKPWEKLKFAFLGGGPIDENILQTGLGLGWPLITVYGSTETTSMVTASLKDNLLLNGLSAGKQFEGVKIKIIDKAGRKVNKNKIGEIVIQSKSVAYGYYKPENDLSRKLNNGKYFTSDFGKIDDNGNLNVLGRMDDIIISGGENISLSEIESIVKQIDIIRDCSTLAVSDVKWGQSYILFVELNKKTSIKNIHHILSGKISSYKMPKEIIIVEKIPKNELGKVQKNKLSKRIN